MRKKTRIDRLVGDHAARLSERLQAHREQLFPPNARKELRKFTSGEVAALLGVKDAYLRKLHLEGRGRRPRRGPAGGATTHLQTFRNFGRPLKKVRNLPEPICPVAAKAIIFR